MRFRDVHRHGRYVWRPKLGRWGHADAGPGAPWAPVLVVGFADRPVADVRRVRTGSYYCEDCHDEHDVYGPRPVGRPYRHITVRLADVPLPDRAVLGEMLGLCSPSDWRRLADQVHGAARANTFDVHPHALVGDLDDLVSAARRVAEEADRARAAVLRDDWQALAERWAATTETSPHQMGDRHDGLWLPAGTARSVLDLIDALRREVG